MPSLCPDILGRVMRSLVSLLLVAPLLVGCADNPTVVALLMADEDSAEEALVDPLTFEERVEAVCDECQVEVYDAGGDGAEQKSQLRQALAESADAIVIEPIDAEVASGVPHEDVPLVALGAAADGMDAFAGLNAPAPPRAGDDLEAARDIVLGREKTMSYVPVVAMTEQAVDAALSLMVGDEPSGGEMVDGAPTWTFEAIQVDIDNLTTVLVGQGALTLRELCEGSTRKKCTELGLY